MPTFRQARLEQLERVLSVRESAPRDRGKGRSRTALDQEISAEGRRRISLAENSAERILSMQLENQLPPTIGTNPIRLQCLPTCNTRKRAYADCGQR
jgi:hypothetical protein